MGRGGEVLPSRDSTRIVISDVEKIGIFLFSSKFFLRFYKFFANSELVFVENVYLSTCICLVRQRSSLRRTEPMGGALHIRRRYDE